MKSSLSSEDSHFQLLMPCRCITTKQDPTNDVSVKPLFRKLDASAMRQMHTPGNEMMSGLIQNLLHAAVSTRPVDGRVNEVPAFLFDIKLLSSATNGHALSTLAFYILVHERHGHCVSGEMLSHLSELKPRPHASLLLSSYCWRLVFDLLTVGP